MSGFLSLSRMFMIVFSFVILIHFMGVMGFKRQHTAQRRFIFSFLFLLSIVVFAFSNEIFNYVSLTISRFTEYGNNLNLLTSNRNIIVQEIMAFLLSNPLYFLFGVGIQNYGSRVGSMVYAHNIFIELLAAWGVVGLILFLVFIIIAIMNIRANYYMKRIQNPIKGTNIVGWLPFICMAVSYLSLNAIEVESFYILLIFVIKNIYDCDEYKNS